MTVTAYVGLGSNLSDPPAQLRTAMQALSSIQGAELIRSSSLYGSDPLGPSDQPRYVNAVVALETTLSPIALLDALQSIEQQHGRVRKAERWGPRTLDLDILLFGNQTIDEPRLTVPHYHMHARPFVLYPLSEIAPELALPNGDSLAEWLEKCPSDGLEIIAPPPG
ncbi:2-amino-4-hydroxy-6-hydroxymethyldihydropteridine diphosphokinase [Pseudomonas sp. Marseille-QA0892]